MSNYSSIVLALFFVFSATFRLIFVLRPTQVLTKIIVSVLKAISFVIKALFS